MQDNSTKQKIIDAMFTLVAQKGYDKASIGQIADAIGIKKASVYYYFSSKEDIFIAMARQLYQDDSAPTAFSCTDADTFRALLLTFGNDLIDSYFAKPDLRKVYAEIDLQTTRIPALIELNAALDRELQADIHEYMVHGVAGGFFAPQFDITAHAQLLFTILVGIDAAILYDLPIAPKEVWALAVAGLFSPKG